MIDQQASAHIDTIDQRMARPVGATPSTMKEAFELSGVKVGGNGSVKPELASVGLQDHAFLRTYDGAGYNPFDQSRKKTLIGKQVEIPMLPDVEQFHVTDKIARSVPWKVERPRNRKSQYHKSLPTSNMASERADTRRYRQDRDIFSGGGTPVKKVLVN